MSPKTAFIISDILSDNLARASAFGYNSVLNIKKAKVAVKTGTSNDLRDNWTIGYTPDFLVATWVGNNDNSPMSYVASGVTGASPIWAKIVDYLLVKNPTPSPFTPPESIISVRICPTTGTLSCNNCSSRQEYFIKGTQPIKACNPDSLPAKQENQQAQHSPPALPTLTPIRL